MRTSNNWLEKRKKRERLLARIQNITIGSMIAAITIGPLIYFAAVAVPLELRESRMPSEFMTQQAATPDVATVLDLAATPEISVSDEPIDFEIITAKTQEKQAINEKLKQKEGLDIELATDKIPEKLKQKEYVEESTTQDINESDKETLIREFNIRDTLKQDVEIKEISNNIEGFEEKTFIMENVEMDIGPNKIQKNDDAEIVARNAARKYLKIREDGSEYDVLIDTSNLKNNKSLYQLIHSDTKFNNGKWYVTYQQYKNGLPVFDGNLKFIFTDRKKLLTITDNLKTNIADETEFALSTSFVQEKAVEIFEWDSDLDKIEFTEKGYYKAKPVYKVSAEAHNPLGEWEVIVDSVTGEIEKTESNIRMQDLPPEVINQTEPTAEPEINIALEEPIVDQPGTEEPDIQIVDTFYSQVLGKIFPQTPADEPVNKPFPNEYVYFDLNQAITDDDGFFENRDRNWYSVFLEGPYVVVYDDTATYDAEIKDRTPEDPFIWDESSASLAAINAFYHTNRIHDYFADNFNLNINKQMPLTVNSELVDLYLEGCGAWFDNNQKTIELGSAEAFPCEEELNYALSSDIIYHEYAHFAMEEITHLPNVPGSESAAMAEGLSDYFAATINNDPLWGEVVAPNRTRNLDNELNYQTDWISISHKNGMILSGALWDLREEIGKDATDRLVFNTLYQDRLHFETFMYGMIIEDDDNNDFTDGTPHLIEILRAFEKHGIGPGVTNFDALPITPEAWAELLKEKPSPEDAVYDDTYYGALSAGCDTTTFSGYLYVPAGIYCYVETSLHTFTYGVMNYGNTYVRNSGRISTGAGGDWYAYASSYSYVYSTAYVNLGDRLYVYNGAWVQMGAGSNGYGYIIVGGNLYLYAGGTIRTYGTTYTGDRYIRVNGTSAIEGTLDLQGLTSYTTTPVLIDNRNRLNNTTYVPDGGSISVAANIHLYVPTTVYIGETDGAPTGGHMVSSSNLVQIQNLYIFYNATAGRGDYINNFGGRLDVDYLYLGEDGSPLGGTFTNNGTLDVTFDAYVYDGGYLDNNSSDVTTIGGTLNVGSGSLAGGRVDNSGSLTVQTSTTVNHNSDTTEGKIFNYLGSTFNANGTIYFGTTTSNGGDIDNSGTFSTYNCYARYQADIVNNTTGVFTVNNNIWIGDDDGSPTGGHIENWGDFNVSNYTYLYYNSATDYGDIDNNSGGTYDTSYLAIGQNDGTPAGGHFQNDGTLGINNAWVYRNGYLDNNNIVNTQYIRAESTDNYFGVIDNVGTINQTNGASSFTLNDRGRLLNSGIITVAGNLVLDQVSTFTEAARPFLKNTNGRIDVTGNIEMYDYGYIANYTNVSSPSTQRIRTSAQLNIRNNNKIFNAGTFDVYSNNTTLYNDAQFLNANSMHSGTLNFDGQTLNISNGAVITGATSGATATVSSQIDNGAYGTFTLTNVVGVFIDNEYLTGSTGGNGYVNGALNPAHAAGNLNLKNLTLNDNSDITNGQSSSLDYGIISVADDVLMLGTSSIQNYYNFLQTGTTDGTNQFYMGGTGTFFANGSSSDSTATYQNLNSTNGLEGEMYVNGAAIVWNYGDADVHELKVGVDSLNNQTPGGDFYNFAGATLDVNRTDNQDPYILYDTETADFTVGATLTGGTTGHTAKIKTITDNGNFGTLYLRDVNGLFLNNETLTDSLGGAALANSQVTGQFSAMVNQGTIQNAGTIDIDGRVSLTSASGSDVGAIWNSSGTTTISSATINDYSFLQASGGSITVDGNGTTSNADVIMFDNNSVIYSLTGGAVTINDALYMYDDALIDNDATITVNGPAEQNLTSDIDNDGTLYLNGGLSMSGNSYCNNGGFDYIYIGDGTTEDLIMTDSTNFDNYGYVYIKDDMLLGNTEPGEGSDARYWNSSGETHLTDSIDNEIFMLDDTEVSNYNGTIEADYTGSDTDGIISVYENSNLANASGTIQATQIHVGYNGYRNSPATTNYDGGTVNNSGTGVIEVSSASTDAFEIRRATVTDTDSAYINLTGNGTMRLAGAAVDVGTYTHNSSGTSTLNFAAFSLSNVTVQNGTLDANSCAIDEDLSGNGTAGVMSGATLDCTTINIGTGTFAPGAVNVYGTLITEVMYVYEDAISTTSYEVTIYSGGFLDVGTALDVGSATYNGGEIYNNSGDGALGGNQGIVGNINIYNGGKVYNGEARDPDGYSNPLNVNMPPTNSNAEINYVSTPGANDDIVMFGGSVISSSGKIGGDEFKFEDTTTGYRWAYNNNLGDLVPDTITLYQSGGLYNGNSGDLNVEINSGTVQIYDNTLIQSWGNITTDFLNVGDSIHTTGGDLYINDGAVAVSSTGSIAATVYSGSIYEYSNADGFEVAGRLTVKGTTFLPGLVNLDTNVGAVTNVGELYIENDGTVNVITPMEVLDSISTGTLNITGSAALSLGTLNIYNDATYGSFIRVDGPTNVNNYGKINNLTEGWGDVGGLEAKELVTVLANGSIVSDEDSRFDFENGITTAGTVELDDDVNAVNNTVSGLAIEVTGGTTTLGTATNVGDANSQDIEVSGGTFNSYSDLAVEGASFGEANVTITGASTEAYFENAITPVLCKTDIHGDFDILLDATATINCERKPAVNVHSGSPGGITTVEGTLILNTNLYTEDMIVGGTTAGTVTHDLVGPTYITNGTDIVFDLRVLNDLDINSNGAIDVSAKSTYMTSGFTNANVFGGTYGGKGQVSDTLTNVDEYGMLTTPYDETAYNNFHADFGVAGKSFETISPNSPKLEAFGGGKAEITVGGNLNIDSGGFIMANGQNSSTNIACGSGGSLLIWNALPTSTLTGFGNITATGGNCGPGLAGGGGRIYIDYWDKTGFYGNITARGGASIPTVTFYYAADGTIFMRWRDFWENQRKGVLWILGNGSALPDLFRDGSTDENDATATPTAITGGPEGNPSEVWFDVDSVQVENNAAFYSKGGCGTGCSIIQQCIVDTTSLVHFPSGGTNQFEYNSEHTPAQLRACYMTPDPAYSLFINNSSTGAGSGQASDKTNLATIEDVTPAISAFHNDAEFDSNPGGDRDTDSAIEVQFQIAPSLYYLWMDDTVNYTCDDDEISITTVPDDTQMADHIIDEGVCTLAGGNTYYWRARFKDNKLGLNGWGLWSETGQFHVNEGGTIDLTSCGSADIDYDTQTGGDFTVGNTLTDTTSGATGTIIAETNGTPGTVTVQITSGTFSSGDSITDGTSTANVSINPTYIFNIGPYDSSQGDNFFDDYCNFDTEGTVTMYIKASKDDLLSNDISPSIKIRDMIDEEYDSLPDMDGTTVGGVLTNESGFYLSNVDTVEFTVGEFNGFGDKYTDYWSNLPVDSPSSNRILTSSGGYSNQSFTFNLGAFIHGLIPHPTDPISNNPSGNTCTGETVTNNCVSLSGNYTATMTLTASTSP